eukprot:418982_1
MLNTYLIWERIFLIIFCSLIVSLSQIIYVTKNGTDSNGCGETIFNACGTFYHASVIALFSNDSIFIHDGQNKDEIKKYFHTSESSIYHPCLPIYWRYDYYNQPEADFYNMSIIFNPLYIHHMDDWFMKGVCYDNNQTIQYINTYLFAIPYFKSLVININNLHVDNLNSDSKPFHLFSIYSTTFPYTYIVCDECVFKHVNVHDKDPMIDISGVYTGLKLNNCMFMDIHIDNFIYTSIYDEFSLQLYNTTITNSTFSQTVVEINNNAYGAVIEQFMVSSDILIYKCQFINIETPESIITTDDLSIINIS